jgi:hypothetical protein
LTPLGARNQRTIVMTAATKNAILAMDVWAYWLDTASKRVEVDGGVEVEVEVEVPLLRSSRDASEWVAMVRSCAMFVVVVAVVVCLPGEENALRSSSCG